MDDDTTAVSEAQQDEVDHAVAQWHATVDDLYALQVENNKMLHEVHDFVLTIKAAAPMVEEQVAKMPSFLTGGLGSILGALSR